LIHIDFIQLVEGKPVTMDIPVVLHGQARGVLNGGKLKSVLRKLSVRAVPGQLPESVDLDINELKIGKSIRVSDVKSEGFEILNASTAVIVTVKKARGAVDEDEEGDDETAEEGAEATAEAAAE
jgi:large subunit ribosomal protein L25